MPIKTSQLVQSTLNKKITNFESEFKQIMQQKIRVKMDELRVQTAKNLFVK